MGFSFLSQLIIFMLHHYFPNYQPSSQPCMSSSGIPIGIYGSTMPAGGAEFFFIGTGVYLISTRLLFFIKELVFR